MPSSFRLVLRSGPTAGKVMPLEKGEIVIGRDLTNDVVLNDPEISRRHARLYAQGNTYVLEDLGSTNGTFVGGQRLTGPYPLRVGETVTFGERMTVVFEAEISEDVTTVAPVQRSAPPPVVQQVQQQPVQSIPEPVVRPTQIPVQSEPAYQMPAPIPQQPIYAGQVPMAEPEFAEAKPRNRTTMIILIVLAVILIFSCICVGVLLWNAPLEFWCQFPIWPTGACP